MFTAATLQSGNLPQRKPISLMAQVVRARVGRIESVPFETNNTDCINHCHAPAVWPQVSTFIPGLAESVDTPAT